MKPPEQLGVEKKRMSRAEANPTFWSRTTAEVIVTAEMNFIFTGGMKRIE